MNTLEIIGASCILVCAVIVAHTVWTILRDKMQEYRNKKAIAERNDL